MTTLFNPRLAYIVTNNDQFMDLAVAVMTREGTTSSLREVLFLSTMRSHLMEGTLISETENAIRIKGGDNEIDIRPLTLSAYNAIKNTLEAPPEFNSEAEMHRFYLDTFGLPEAELRQKAKNWT